MKREITPLSGRLLIAYRILVALIIALAVVLITGSLYALFRSPNSGPLFRIGSANAAAGGKQGRRSPDTEEVSPTALPNVFSGIGRLRIPLAGEPAAALVLSISFPYSADDRPFAEELASRIGDFRSLAAEYFTSLPREKAVDLDEEAAKAGILGRYNAMLRLGRIETLYFGDLMIVE